jgi:hypothetical protein
MEKLVVCRLCEKVSFNYKSVQYLHDNGQSWLAKQCRFKFVRDVRENISQSEDQTMDRESDDEEEEQQVMIDWALEWWRKLGAPIVT